MASNAIRPYQPKEQSEGRVINTKVKEIQKKNKPHFFDILNNEPNKKKKMKISFPRYLIPNIRKNLNLFTNFFHEISKIQQDPYNPETSADPTISPIDEDEKTSRTLHVLSQEFTKKFWKEILIKGNPKRIFEDDVPYNSIWGLYEDLEKQYKKMLQINSEIESSSDPIIQKHFQPLEIFGLFEIETLNQEKRNNKEQFLCMEYLNPHNWRKHVESTIISGKKDKRSRKIKRWFIAEDHPVLAKIANQQEYSADFPKYTYKQLMGWLKSRWIHLTDLRWKNILYKDLEDWTKIYTFIDQRDDGRIYH